MIDPRFMSVENWCAFTGTLIESYGYIPKLASADDWKKWAAYVISLPQIAATNAPRPERFSAWQDWAAQFNQNVGLVISN